MGKRETMEIPYPVAFPEEVVLVLNYRMKPALWEEGKVRDFRFRPAHFRTTYSGEKYQVPSIWSFDVWIERPVVEQRYGKSRGGGYNISVGAEAIRRIK
jgi:hypothetical protein